MQSEKMNWPVQMEGKEEKGAQSNILQVIKILNSVHIMKTNFYSGSTCEATGVLALQLEVDLEFSNQIGKWESCAIICRRHDLCSHWVYRQSECWLRGGSFSAWHGNADSFTTGYRDCTPGKFF